MRRKVQQQPALLSRWIDSGLSKELELVSELLDGMPELLDLVNRDLVRSGANPNIGRRAVSAELLLRALLLKQRNGDTYAELSFKLADSNSYRTFCRLGLGEAAPSKSTLQRNIKMITAQTLEAMNRVILARAGERGIERGKKVRIDTTVTATNIHRPTDSSLLWDCVRSITRLLRRANRFLPVTFRDHCRRAKRRWTAISYARNEAGRFEAYKDLIAITERTARYAKRALNLLDEVKKRACRLGRTARRLSEKLLDRLTQTARVLLQARRRVLQGEPVASGEKLVSIFESHTDIIVKDRRDTLYGHKITLSAGRSGLVLDCVIESGNPPDSSLAVSMTARQAQIYGRPPRQVAMDGGFTSQQNLLDIKAMGVKDVLFTKARSIPVTDMVQSNWVNRQLRRFRAGIEGTISFLKRVFGLTRCNWHGLQSFHAYVWASVLSANLLVMARRLR